MPFPTNGSAPTASATRASAYLSVYTMDSDELSVLTLKASRGIVATMQTNAMWYSSGHLVDGLEMRIHVFNAPSTEMSRVVGVARIIQLLLQTEFDWILLHKVNLLMN
ncbi:predicted protein [Plenodomus lingam JN3]|uniref:Predicted protein n=1 Tax=Leptosphaeria maculans (strain JN3 / isolate v23.1.3 / race Av1-4-5-6-7-8) TaxID=985895 RepID=E5A4P8_LEPMJ|nr:predicted protein [Plenodomus lingam JN3]CBX98596.1 predicted protein [Plenodomus lingam JN3]